MSESLYVDTHAEAWRPSPCAGVAWKKLRHDPTRGESAVLLRFDPGADYAAHRHPAGEQYFVLEGELIDGARRWGPGAYVYHPPGSTHAPRSESGCLVFVTLPAPIEILAGGSASEGGETARPRS